MYKPSPTLLRPGRSSSQSQTVSCRTDSLERQGVIFILYVLCLTIMGGGTK